MFVEPECTVIHGAIVEDKPFPSVNRSAGSFKSGKKRP
jgi:hypothetical protein